MPERIPGLVTTAQTGNASVANSNLIARRAIESAFISTALGVMAAGSALTGHFMKSNRDRMKGSVCSPGGFFSFGLHGARPDRCCACLGNRNVAKNAKVAVKPGF